MAKILIVEDEPAMQLGLRDNLEFEGYQVSTADDGLQGLELIKSNSYDLVLLDVMLPKLSGLDVCKKIREANINVPIILLTAKGEEIDKVLGLELGADDYVTKPFSVRELLARIKAHLRRVPQQNSMEQEVQIGKLNINFSAYTATSDLGDERLSHKEFEILKYLFENKNNVVSRDQLLENIWGYQEAPTTRTVDNFVLRLRQKIEDQPDHPGILITVHGVGYKLLI